MFILVLFSKVILLCFSFHPLRKGTKHSSLHLHALLFLILFFTPFHTFILPFPLPFLPKSTTRTLLILHILHYKESNPEHLTRYRIKSLQFVTRQDFRSHVYSQEHCTCLNCCVEECKPYHVFLLCFPIFPAFFVVFLAVLWLV